MARDDEYVICPHCGKEHENAWEWCKSETPSTVRCQHCDQPFSAWVEYSVDYVTYLQIQIED